MDTVMVCPHTQDLCRSSGCVNRCSQDLYYVPQDQGWQCPVCKAVFSPKVMECHYCNKDRLL